LQILSNVDKIYQWVVNHRFLQKDFLSLGSLQHIVKFSRFESGIVYLKSTTPIIKFVSILQNRKLHLLKFLRKTSQALQGITVFDFSGSISYQFCFKFSILIIKYEARLKWKIFKEENVIQCITSLSYLENLDRIESDSSLTRKLEKQHEYKNNQQRMKNWLLENIRELKLLWRFLLNIIV